MRIYLVQHGEALSKDRNPERPLSEQGQADVQRMAEFLDRAGVRVRHVLHSGKLRAEQTARILSERLLEEGKIELFTGIRPNDAVQVVARQLADRSEDRLIVGHLPFMARLVSLLLIGDSEAGVVSYRPGSVVCMERDQQQAWHMEWMLRPELLRPVE